MKFGLTKFTLSLDRLTGTCARPLLAAMFASWLVLALTLPAWSQSTWQTEVVDDGGGTEDVGRSASLALDRSGNLHIAYYNMSRDTLWYAFREKDSNRWSKMPVEGHTGSYLSLALDSLGHPHISCVDKWEDGLHYDYYDGKTWHGQIIDPLRVDYYNSIQLDANDHPRISYYLYHNQEGHYVLHLKYAFFDGHKWFIQTVDRHQGTGKWNSLAVDRAGNPHIAYSHVGLGDLLYAHWNGSEWQYGDADSRRLSGSYVGYGNSIDVDQAGNPHVASFDLTKKAVRYAYWDGKQWKAETVDELSDKNELDHVSLKVDAQGHPHLAYYDAGAGVLKYAVRGADGWKIQIVDRSGNAGLNPSLFLDAQGTPYVAYVDVTKHSLKLAHMILSPESATVKK